VTLTWTDSDVTKGWLGCTWTNGETKEVYATWWRPADPGELPFCRCTWNVGADFLFAIQATYELRELRVDGPSFYFRKNDNTMLAFPPYSQFITTAVASYNTNKSAMCGLTDNSMVDSGSITSTDGLTISWGRGNGW